MAGLGKGCLEMKGKFRLTSRMMKKIKSIPLSATRIQKSHQVAFAGNNSMKHLLG